MPEAMHEICPISLAGNCCTLETDPLNAGCKHAWCLFTSTETLATYWYAITRCIARLD